MRNLIIGTAGHIDHGKTVLVKALTGKDTDRLAEEKERGISIDLGFAPFELPDNTIAGIVDVPGHENFVRNMVAGATGVDLALLVVAADDGVMPQTKEHLAILELLGVTSAVVALTKTDLVEEELIPMVIEEINDLLQDTALEGSRVVPVSAVSGHGLDQLTDALQKAAGEVRLKNQSSPPRLPIDRVFTLKGIGTVVTGTLWNGTMKTGDVLELLPQRRNVRIRSLQVHDSEQDRVYAGQRVAANLAGISKSELARGDVLLAHGYLQPTHMVDARVMYLGDNQKPLKRGTRLRFHHGTREILGRVYPFEGKALAPGEELPCQFRLEAEVVCAPGDKFVLRSYSPVTTIGGGIVVDPYPGKHKVHDPEASREFGELESGDESRSVAVYLSREGEPVSAGEIVLDSGLPPGLVEGALDDLVASGRALALGEKGSATYLSRDQYSEITEKIEKFLRRFHDSEPLEEGIAKETLKEKTLSSWDSRSAESLIEEMLRKGLLESEGKIVRLPGRGASTSKEQEQLMEQIIHRIEQQSVSPPTLPELATEFNLDKKMLAGLLVIAEKEKKVVRVSPQQYFSPKTVSDVESKLKEALRSGGVTVSEFKKLIGTTRKFALPLLEYFDRTRITVRQGDIRKLRR